MQHSRKPEHEDRNPNFTHAAAHAYKVSGTESKDAKRWQPLQKVRENMHMPLLSSLPDKP